MGGRSSKNRNRDNSIFNMEHPDNQRKTLRKKKDKFIKTMKNDQLIMAQYNKEANNEIIQSFKEKNILNSVHIYFFIYLFSKVGKYSAKII